MMLQGYAGIVALHTVVNGGHMVSLVHLMNTIGYVVLTIPLAYLIPQGKHQHLHHFEWTTSYIVSWTGVGFGLLTSFLYVVHGNLG